MAPCKVARTNVSRLATVQVVKVLVTDKYEQGFSCSHASVIPPAGVCEAACSKGRKQVPNAARGWSSGLMRGLGSPNEAVSTAGLKFDQPFGARARLVVSGACNCALAPEDGTLPELRESKHVPAGGNPALLEKMQLQIKQIPALAERANN